MSKNIFLIGPASVGKTTVGGLLAESLDYKFIDIDEEFCKRIALIPDVVKTQGYPEYCEQNSKLVDALILENSKNTVFATPSGFLVHEESPHLVQKHLGIIKKGISILLLPSDDPHTHVDLIVARQMKRWSDVNSDKEKERFLDRFKKYKNYGDIKIFPTEKPNLIVEMLLKKI